MKILAHLCNTRKKVKKDHKTERLSMQAVEEEVKKRRAAEDARAQLEERMKLLKQGMDGGKKKKGWLSTKLDEALLLGWMLFILSFPITTKLASIDQNT